MNEVTRKLHEQGLITKNCIATHTDLIFKFNLALYSSAETFYNRKMFQAKVFTVKMKLQYVTMYLSCG